MTLTIDGRLPYELPTWAYELFAAGLFEFRRGVPGHDYNVTFHENSKGVLQIIGTSPPVMTPRSKLQGSEGRRSAKIRRGAKGLSVSSFQGAHRITEASMEQRNSLQHSPSKGVR